MCCYLSPQEKWADEDRVWRWWYGTIPSSPAWYAVTRLVSSILGCQQPRSSFQIATIVELKSRPTTNQPQWSGQASNADRNISQKFPSNRVPENALLMDRIFSGLQSWNCGFETIKRTRWVTLPVTRLISIIWKNASGHCTYLYVYCVVEEHQMTTKRAVSFWYRRICDLMR